MTTDVAVLIVEPNRVFRRGLEACLDDIDGIGLLGSVPFTGDAWTSPALGEVDVVLLSVDAGGALPFITEVGEFSNTSVVAFGRTLDRSTLLSALEMGAAAALDSDALTPEGLVMAIRATAYGGPFVLPAPRDLVASRPAATPALNEREQLVLAMVADGFPTREVAVEMNYSERTVKKVLGDVVVKLGARSRSQAIAHAVRQGII